MINVHFFAAARAAAGQSQQGIELSELSAGAPTITDLTQWLEKNHSGRTPSGMTLGHVLQQCSFLVNGTRAEHEVKLTDGDRVDILPPFAGG